MVRIGLAQINTTVGDIKGNFQKILDYILKAKKSGVDIISFPELAITGYPPEDLLLKPKFVEENIKMLEKLAIEINNIVAVVGFVNRKNKNLYNAAAVLYKKKIIGIYHKILLPNYGVFDEKRYFTQGDEPTIFKIDEVIFGVNICEDIWHKTGPTKTQASRGAQLIININGSPYHTGKWKERETVIRNASIENNVWISYTNLVGGQDELVFDGQSMVMNNKGILIAKADAFKGCLLITDIEIENNSEVKSNSRKYFIDKKKLNFFDPIEEIYMALVTGLKDYVHKNGFKKVVIGLSGGIDSSLVAAIASDALGKENVVGVFMPSRYSSQESQIDAAHLAKNLGIKFLTIPIEPIFKIYLLTLEHHFGELEKDITEENLQARIRGNILMALSNKFGWLVLTTGNKSEMSVGYATLYGDMAGGFAVIKDVYKTMVYKLADYRNSINKVIPDRIMAKEPTAELKPNQKDTDSLPPYEILDSILKEYIEKDRNFDEIVSMGFSKDIVRKVIKMVDRNEYKRRQSPPGIKITPKAFGRDRRVPITNKYQS